jgi:hypothetical protein
VATSHEKLLGPVLRLLAAKGELSISDTTSLLSESPSDTLERPTRTASDIVAAALNSLGTAGLLERTSPDVWRITPEGKALAEREPLELRFETLKQYPSYNAYWACIARDNLRQKFLELRFEHYASGRLLFLQGSHAAAAVLLAYSIEYYLKAALIEVEATWTPQERALVRGSHNLVELYHLCLRRGLLTDSYVSFDFMKYAHDHFERRYPSGERSVLSGRGYWSFGGSMLYTYDDCIVQLDRAVANTYNSHAWRVGVHALADTVVSPRLVDALFHANVFAIEDLRADRAALAGLGVKFDATILDHPDQLYFRDGLPVHASTYERAKELLKYQLAAYFRYPKQEEPDPDPARVSAANDRDRSAATGVISCRWAIDRVVKAFRKEAVELTENLEARQVLLTVFDRRAKHWYRRLVLREGNLPLLFRNEESEAVVEQWIADTRSSFARLRPNLRIPPKRAPLVS